MASVRTESVSPFSIYEENNDLNHDAENHMSSEYQDQPNEGCDVPLASIENEAPRPRTAQDRHKRLSNVTTTSVSSFPSDLASEELEQELHANLKLYTPMRSRPAFRNTSSVKAMQMSSPRPSLPSSPPRLNRPQHLTPSRSGTPQSQRSYSMRSDRQLERRYEDARRTPVYETPKRDHPLVLLHVTLLAPSIPYPAPILEAILPDWLLENFRLLESRLDDSTLMGRGLLIPHPRHEYELLEERLLESLDLAPPRLLKSGHFYRHRSSSYDSNQRYSFAEEEDDDGATARGIGSESGLDEELENDTCPDCSQPMGFPNKGAGSGKHKWDVKIYAANGLMRSGAWSAAWMEMERVDVEVLPWIPDYLKKQLEIETRTDEQSRRLQKEVELNLRHGIPTPPVSEAPHSRQPSNVEVGANELPQVSQIHVPDAPTMTADISRSTAPRRQSNKEIPLTAALLNYIYLVAQDTRNLMVIGLSLIVLFLCIKPPPSSSGLESGMADTHLLTTVAEAASPITETVVATETVLATEFLTATSTVSEIVFQTISKVLHVPSDDAESPGTVNSGRPVEPAELVEYGKEPTASIFDNQQEDRGTCDNDSVPFPQRFTRICRLERSHDHPSDARASY